MVDGQHLTFDVLGLLDGVFRMRDRETGTIWTHLDGKAIAGPLDGQRLSMVPIPQTTWGQWKSDYADTLVLDPDTQFQDRYVRPVQIGVFNPNEAIYGDDRLPSNTLVVGVEIEGVYKGYPIAQLEEAGSVINDTVGGQPIVVFYDSEARTGVAYLRQVDGQVLEFDNVMEDGFEIKDRATGSSWDIHGRTANGAYGEVRLEFVPSFISEWYGWSAYHPESELYQARLSQR